MVDYSITVTLLIAGQPFRFKVLAVFVLSKKRKNKPVSFARNTCNFPRQVNLKCIETRITENVFSFDSQINSWGKD